MASDAVGLERISRIVGYKITKGNFATSSPNLPQRIAVLGEANTANQGTLDTDAYEITSAQQAGDRYGYGSPIYLMARIVFPIQGGGVGGVPVVVYPQAEAGGATAKVLEITPTGTATGNGTHYLKVAGRDGLDGEYYAINVVDGDTAASKWKGLTANELSITVDTGDDDLGITYAVVSTQSGAGTPSISAALTSFGTDWNTIVVNGYGTQSTVMASLESFNGIPDATNPTGRFVGIVMKPFVAITGSTADDPTSVTDARKTDVTIAIAPAPGSAAIHFEAAANMAVLYSVVSQNNPHLDVAGKAYADMPAPTSIGSMADYNNRDSFVKKGCSTVDLVAGKYIVQDFVTTYHPVGETPPQFRYCRNLMLDFNVRYGYYLLEQINVVDHAIASNNDVVSVQSTIKPKQWIQILNAYADDLGILTHASRTVTG